MNRVFITLALLATQAIAEPAPAASSTGRKGRIDRVVAVVGNTVILASELDTRMGPIKAEASSIADPTERARRIAKLEGQVLEELIGDELVAQAAIAAGIEVDNAEVSAAYDNVKQDNNLTDDQFVAALAEQGMTPAAYRQLLRSQLLRIRAVQQFVRPKVTVTDDDVKAAYAQRIRRSDGTSEIKLAHMLFPLAQGATADAAKAAQVAAETALAKVKAGAAFADVAKELSGDAATKDSGGELGWFERGSLSPQWEVILFAMPVGDVRGPIAGPNGLHVFTVLDTKRGGAEPFEQVKEQLKTELTRRETDKQSGIWMAELRKKTFVRNKL